MIKVKVTISELEVFANYLQTCLTSEAKTGDLVKEYFLADAIKHLYQRANKKLYDADHEFLDRSVKVTKESTLKIMNCEVLALSVFFKRLPVHNYILSVEREILEQMPVDIIKVLNPTHSVFKTTSNEVD